ncbi:hypothetical protein D3C81_1394500 [compost metagenome]
MFTVGSVTQLKPIADLPASAPPAKLKAICVGIAAGAAADAVIGVATPEMAKNTTKMVKNSLGLRFFVLYNLKTPLF